MARINTNMLNGIRLGRFTMGYRKKWLVLPFYLSGSRPEKAIFTGLGPLYFRVKYA